MHVVPVVVEEGNCRRDMSPRQALHNAANVLIIYQQLHNKLGLSRYLLPRKCCSRLPDLQYFHKRSIYLHFVAHYDVFVKAPSLNNRICLS